MSAVQQWEWEEEKPRSRLSEAELGETLFSTKAGRRLLIIMMMGGAVFVAAWVKAPHALAVVCHQASRSWSSSARSTNVPADPR